MRRSRLRLSAAFCLVFLVAATEAVRAQSVPVPLIDQPLAPDAAVPGSQEFTLTVNGAGFVKGSIVEWNRAPLATTFVSAAQLTAAVPASLVKAAGTASVTVNNGQPGAVSAAAYFELRRPFPSIGFSSSSYAVGPEPNDLVTADFNGDGYLDLATADVDPGDVSVLFGNGDGTFQPAAIYDEEDKFPRFLVPGDFNGDGKVDLAVFLDNIDGQIAVLPGIGNGTFGSPIVSTVGLFSYNLFSADFNGDGKLDLAFTTGPNKVGIMLGNGDGTFQAPLYYGAGSSAAGATVGDFNGDGIVDIAVAARFDNAVAILLGNGDGTFRSNGQYLTADEPINITAGDFNGDGKLDVATSTFEGIVSVLLGNGDGTLQSYTGYGTENLAEDIAEADLRGEGFLDLQISAGPLFVLNGKGNGTFESPARFSLISQETVGTVVPGDFNGDGLMDLAGAAYSSNAVTVALQSGSALSPTHIDFGKVKMGSASQPAQVTLTNYGGSAFTVTAVSIRGRLGPPFTETDNCLNQHLAPGAACTIGITFGPQATGLFTAMLVVRDTNTATEQTVGLSGLGIE
jgi:archaellum component FlaF (FlaF/FlaG flagellin family)